MSTTKKLVIILGPTASGKTSLGLEIAKKLNTEQAKYYLGLVCAFQ